MIIACATNDGKSFVSCHFGDAEKYLIFDLDKRGYEFIGTISNTTSEEDGVHADPKKAKGIVNLLKMNDVQVGVTKVFGPNIKRIVKHFLPVIVQEDNIEEGLRQLSKNFEKIEGIIKEDKRNTCLDLGKGQEIKLDA